MECFDKNIFLGIVKSMQNFYGERAKMDFTDKVIIFHNDEGLLKIINKNDRIEKGYNILFSNETINKFLNESKVQECVR